MIIRPAEEEDLPAIAAMGAHFTQATTYGRLFETSAEAIERLVAMVFGLTAQDNAVILLACDERGPFGFLAGVCGLLTGSDTPILDELVWWVEPTRRGARAGPALLEAAERWSRANDLKAVRMVAPFDSGVGRFYVKRGYRAIETSYAKLLE